MAALNYLQTHHGWYAINLGTGIPLSVLDLVSAFEKVIKQELSKTFVSRRPGDLPIYYAKPDRAKTLLNWTSSRTLEEMVESTWLWQKTANNTCA